MKSISHFACVKEAQFMIQGNLQRHCILILSNLDCRNITAKTLPKITIFNLSFHLHILTIFPYILIKTKQNKRNMFISGKKTYKSFPFILEIHFMQLKVSRIRDPKIWLFGTRIIVKWLFLRNWRQLRSSKNQQKLPFCLRYIYIYNENLHL